MWSCENFGLSEDFADALENGGQTVRPENGLPDHETGSDLSVAKIVETPMSVAEKIAALKNFKLSQEKAGQDRKAALAAARNKIVLYPEKRTKKMDGIMAQIAENQRENLGWPVGADGRIVMETFIGHDNYVSEVVSGDIAKVDALSKKKETRDNENSGGKMMEKISHGLLSKYLKGAFSVRAAEFDDKDFAHQVDILIFNDKGSLLAGLACALCEKIGSSFSKTNRSEVDEKNIHGGGQIKYCFQGTGSNITYGPETDVPFFALELDMNTMNTAIDNFDLKGGPNNLKKKQ